jgi:transcriptional regulator with XRE-family HTH domain
MTETFKERMKRMRLRAGLKSQKKAAEAIGCERGTVGMWEAPSSPVDSVSGEYLMQVASAYQVRAEYINTGEGDDGFPWSVEAASESRSHPLRLDPEIVEATHAAMTDMYKRNGRSYPIEAVARFVLVYEKLALRKAGVSEAELFGAGLSDTLTPQGATSERTAGVPSKGTDKGTVARRIRRKA